MLPFDIWIDILSYFDYYDLIIISSTNKSIKDACDETSEFPHILIQKIEYNCVKEMIFSFFKQIFIEQFGISLYYNYHKVHDKNNYNTIIMDAINDNTDYNEEIDNEKITEIYDKMVTSGEILFYKFVRKFYKKNKRKFDAIFNSISELWNQEKTIILYNFEKEKNIYKDNISEKIEKFKSKIEDIDYTKIFLLGCGPIYCHSAMFSVAYNEKENSEYKAFRGSNSYGYKNKYLENKNLFSSFVGQDISHGHKSTLSYKLAGKIKFPQLI